MVLVANTGAFTSATARLKLSSDSRIFRNVHAAPAVSFAWDADSRADGVMSPNRLLINCRPPYSVVTASSQNDEEALGNDDGFPCCRLDPVKF